MPNQVFSQDSNNTGHGSQYFDEDGREKRTGNMWTATAHIITAVIGSGVLSLAWALAQLGWIVGPIALMLFSILTFFTSYLLTYAYRTGDPVTGKRNYTYPEAVRNILGGFNYKFCGVVQYANLFGSGIGYTVAAAQSMQAIQKSICMHTKESCHVSSISVHTIGFGVLEILLSLIPEFHQLWWLSTVAAIMSFTYSTIGMVLGLAKVIQNGRFKGSVGGTKVGLHVTQQEKMWMSFQSLGNIAFAYSFAMVLIEIQNTVKSPPSESKTMKKAAKLSIAGTTIFYTMCGSFGYGAFGDSVPENLLAGFGTFNPYWVLDVANIAIVVHLIGAYQVFTQPLYSFVELKATQNFPNSKFISKEIKIPIPCTKPYTLNLFRVFWRIIYVVITTVISMKLPFFSDIVGLLGAIGFWPMTVFFPIEMYIKQRNIPKCGFKWVVLQILSLVCFVVTVLAAAGSIKGMVKNLTS